MKIAFPTHPLSISSLSSDKTPLESVSHDSAGLALLKSIQQLPGDHESMVADYIAKQETDVPVNTLAYFKFYSTLSGRVWHCSCPLASIDFSVPLRSQSKGYSRYWNSFATT